MRSPRRSSAPTTRGTSCGPARPQRGLRGSPGATLAAGEPAGPQQPCGVLQLVRSGQDGDVPAAVTGSLAGDLGQGRLDDELRGARAPGTSPPGAPRSATRWTSPGRAGLPCG